MSKEWTKIEAAYKKLQPQIKKRDPVGTTKQVKAVKAALESAWDAEEMFIKVVEAAQESGIKGAKLADYDAFKGFKKSLDALKKGAAKHLNEVKALKVLSKASEAPSKELRKLVADVKKHINKKDKAQLKFQKTLIADYDAVLVVAGAMGELTAPETFYGAQIDRSVTNILKKSSGSGGAALSGDANKLIEQKERDKNVKAAVKLAQQVAKLCGGAEKKAEDGPKAAAPYLKKAAAMIKGLKKLDSAYQTVKKKHAKQIKESKDKTKINKAIATIINAHDVSATRFTDALDTVKQSAA